MIFHNNIRPIAVFLTFFIFCTSLTVLAEDDNKKDKNKDKQKKEQVKKNTQEDIGTQVQLKYSENTMYEYGESVEEMANWHIVHNLPKSEKVSKKEEQEITKINRKIIKREKRECKKLQKSIKKGDFQSKSKEQ